MLQPALTTSTTAAIGSITNNNSTAVNATAAAISTIPDRSKSPNNILHTASVSAPTSSTSVTSNKTGEKVIFL